MGLQNAARAENQKVNLSVQVNTGSQSPSAGSAPGTHQNITASINQLEKKLDALMVNYPPFFPIGKYQRLDLIKKIKGVQEEVEKSSLHNDLKNSLTHTRLKDNASDKDIASAMDSLFELRNKLVRKESAPADTTTGMILNIKV